MEKIIIMPKEVKVILMALQTMEEDLSETITNASIPFNGEARQIGKEILSTIKIARGKLIKLTGEFMMEPYADGDEKEFLTKES